jgi:hypothetical protein
MKDLLDKLYAIEKDLTVINESTDPLNEVSSMNISMTGDNADEVAQLLNIMRAGGDVMPRPEMPKAPSQDMDMHKALSIMGPPGGPDMDGGDMELKGADEKATEWANSPDEQYMDHNYMTQDLAGGINRSKSQHKPAADGDNPMAVEGGFKDKEIEIQDALHGFAEELQKGMHSYDNVVDELNDMFDDVKASNDKISMNAFKVLRSLEPEDFGDGEGGGPNRASSIAQDAMDIIDGGDDDEYDHLPKMGEGGGHDMDCDACDGKGNSAGEECDKCHGSGEAGPGEDDYGNESVDAQIEAIKNELYAALKQKQGGGLEEDDIEEGSIKLMHKLHGEGKSHEQIAKQLNMEPSEVKAAMAKTEMSEADGEEYECEYEYYGDDGESQMGELHYKVVGGKVDPNSLRGTADPYSSHNGMNAKVDDDMADEEVAVGGQGHEEAVMYAQSDYDDEHAGKEGTSYSIRGKTPEADAELARIAKNAGVNMSEAKDDDGMDEAGCKSKMKKLNASGCSKNEMYKKINAEYGCGKQKFEKLYASSCGSH